MAYNRLLSKCLVWQHLIFVGMSIASEARCNHMKPKEGMRDVVIVAFHCTIVIRTHLSLLGGKPTTSCSTNWATTLVVSSLILLVVLLGLILGDMASTPHTKTATWKHSFLPAGVA